MKRSILFACLLVTGLLQAQVTFNPDDLHTIAKAEQDAHAGKLTPVSPASTNNYDVNWYRCLWNIDPAIREISGNITTQFTPSGAGLDSLAFDLSDSLTVDSVAYHSHAGSWLHNKNLLSIHFPSTIPYGTIDSVSVFYHGVPPANGFGSFDTATHNGTPILWTLSEPYGSSDWWPCKNSLTDKADSVDIFIRTPSAYKAASNGMLISEAGNKQHMVCHWKHRYPIATYLVCLAVTNYARYSDKVPFGSDTLNVVNYVYPEDSASAAAQTGIIVPMIQLFDSLFGVYPFQREKYGHAQFGWGGGMEHQTMTFVASFGFELLAHELAHQWFGDKVTCGSWVDIWLNEGFATYLSGLCYEFLAPVYWERFREVRVKSITAYPGGTVYCTDTTNVARLFDGRLSYAKGAMILHQLRWICGDSAFFAGLNNYLHDPAVSYGFARTENLKSHLESSFGQDLTWYFDDWFTGEGYPTYHVDWSQKNDTVAFTVNQTQSLPSVSFYEMVIPVQFKNATRDTIIRFSNTFSGQFFTVAIPFPVDSVIFDPEYQLISGNNTTNAVEEHGWRPNLQVFPNPASRLVTFSFRNASANDVGNLNIYDRSGRLTAEIPIQAGDNEINVNTGNYSPGLYFYLLRVQGLQYSGKFVVVRQ